ncbi:hypothetical protein R3I94_010866 [Phoxinus phoxinus]
MVNIRRDEFIVTGHSKVCSLHFTPEEIIQPKTPEGKRQLKKGAVPVLFQWNDYSIPSPRLSVWDRVNKLQPELASVEDGQHMDCTPAADHDYSSVPEPAFMDSAIDENTKLKEENYSLKKEIQELKISCKFGLQRFAHSDDDIRFYTRFPSYHNLMLFWRLVEPSVHKMVRASRAKAAEKLNEAVTSVRPTHTVGFCSCH